MPATGSLLDLVQTALGELALIQPSIVVGSTDLTVTQLKYLVNREGITLMAENEWTALQELNIINITPVLDTTGNVTEGSAVITGIPTTAAITPATAWVCTGSAIPVAARVVSVDSGTQVTLDSEATDSVTALDLTFAQDTYNLPTAFDRYINQTSWDRTNRWQVLGPDTPQIDEWHRSGIVTTGPRRHARQVGVRPTAYRLWPPPGSTETPWETVFEYVSNCWAMNIAGTAIPKMTADDDVSLIDPQVIILGIIYRFLRAKQFAYADQYQEYFNYKQLRIGSDGGARILSMSPPRYPYLINSSQTPDGNWPGPT